MSPLDRIAVALAYLRQRQKQYALGEALATADDTLADLNVIELLLRAAEYDPH
jgi:hypothetical protein